MLKIKASQSQDIYGFIHIGKMNDWERIFNSLLKNIQDSGLFSATKEIYIGVSGDTTFDTPQGTKLAICNPKIKDGEVETLKFLHEMSKKVNGNFWYVHTKGSRWTKESHESKCAESWRNYMEYFVIKNWSNCVKALKTHDACGVEWSPSEWNGKMLFSGNFWWARSDYISSIKTPMVEYDPYDEYRYKAEFLIGKNNPKVKNFFTAQPPTGNLYGIVLNPKIYQKQVQLY